jgi:hypothetical protein
MQASANSRDDGCKGADSKTLFNTCIKRSKSTSIGFSDSSSSMSPKETGSSPVYVSSRRESPIKCNRLLISTGLISLICWRIAHATE